jgi:hypothetical protein
VATIHASGTEVAPHGGRRRATIIAAVALACAVIVVPFGLHGIGKSDARASAAAAATGLPTAPGHRSAVDPIVGSREGLPDLRPADSRLSDGQHVRLGNVTGGVLRRSPAGGWQVLVRWDGRLQPVPTRGPVSLAGGSARHASSWVSDEGLLYTRVAAARHGQFRVFAWVPRGGTAYTPPTLVAGALGRVCFNGSFTAFGDCRTAS